jgi:large subunit ribosomal protein L4
VYLSTRNIPNIDSTLLADINTYEIMNADVLVITESAAKIFNEEPTVA